MYQYRYVRMGRKMIFLAVGSSGNTRYKVERTYLNTDDTCPKFLNPVLWSRLGFPSALGFWCKSGIRTFPLTFVYTQNKLHALVILFFTFYASCLRFAQNLNCFEFFLGWSHSCLQIPLRLHLKKAAPQNCIPPA